MNQHADGLVQRGRNLAESLMGIDFEAYAPASADDVTLDENGYEVAVPALKGDCCGKIQSPSREGDLVTRYFPVGGVPKPVLVGGLHIPIRKFLVDGQLQIKAGDRGVGWEFLAVKVRCPEDMAILGRRYLVVGAPAKSYATARRLDVVEV